MLLRCLPQADIVEYSEKRKRFQEFFTLKANVLSTIFGYFCRSEVTLFILIPLRRPRWEHLHIALYPEYVWSYLCLFPSPLIPAPATADPAKSSVGGLRRIHGADDPISSRRLPRTEGKSSRCTVEVSLIFA